MSSTYKVHVPPCPIYVLRIMYLCTKYEEKSVNIFTFLNFFLLISPFIPIKTHNKKVKKRLVIYREIDIFEIDQKYNYKK